MSNLEEMDLFAEPPRNEAQHWEGVRSHIKLTAVMWDAHNKHTVAWKSEEHRNNYFKQKHGWEMDTAWNFKSLEVWKPGLGHHVGTVRVNLPYEAAMDYNYLTAEMGFQPVPGGEDDRREHFFYFITSLNKIDPNTTELFLELDSWTTFINSLNIAGMNLERGHYGMAQVSATDYLKNPLDNRQWVTGDEPDLPRVKPLVSSENFFSFQKSGPRVCIAMTADLTDPDSLWIDARNPANIKNPKGVTAANRWYERGLNETVSSIGNKGMTPKPSVAANRTNTASSVRVFSTSVGIYPELISILRNKYPQLLKTIQAVYILDSSLIDEGDSLQFEGQLLRPVNQQASPKMLAQLDLTKNLFNYDSRIADIAKLYTEQFAQFELSSLQGERATINVEDIAGDLEIYSRVSLGFPFLKLEAFLNGVGGNATKTYAVRPYAQDTATLFQSSWEDFKVDLAIPTYGVFVENRDIEGFNAQLARFKAKKNAEIRQYIAKLTAEIELGNAKSSISTRLSNENASIGRGFSNASDRIGKSYSNTQDSIGREAFARNQEISRAFDNERASIDREYSAGMAEANYSYNSENAKIQLEQNNGSTQAGTDMGMELAQISVDAAAATNEAIVENVNTINELALAVANTGTEYNRREQVALYQQNRDDVIWDEFHDIERVATEMDMYQSEYLAQADVMMQYSRNSAGSWANPFNVLGNFSKSVLTANEVTNLQDITLKNQDLSVRNFNLEHGDGMQNVSADGKPFSGFFTRKGYSRDKVVYYYKKQLLAFNTRMDLRVLKVTAERTEGVGRGNAGATLGAQLNTINSTSGVRSNNAVQRFSVTMGILSNTASTLSNLTQQKLDLETTINSVKRTLGYNITGRNKSTGGTVLDNWIGVENSIARRERDVETGIATRDRRVDTAIAKANYTTELRNLNRSYDRTLEAIQKEYDSAIADLSADYSDVIFGEPRVFGENSGEAWLDAWAQRGIDVRVRRVSKGDEITIGRTFARYGYRTYPIWVENFDLSLMKYFTYWQGTDPWITGDDINETNKNIIREAFENGVTIWEDPDLVNTSVDILNNTRRV